MIQLFSYLFVLICSGGSKGPERAMAPREIFLVPSLATHFSRRVQNFEFRIYCLLKILANEKE